MPDYKEMYLTLFCATEQAIYTLIAAQHECEDIYQKDLREDLFSLLKHQENDEK